MSDDESTPFPLFSPSNDWNQSTKVAEVVHRASTLKGGGIRNRDIAKYS